MNAKQKQMLGIGIVLILILGFAYQSGVLGLAVLSSSTFTTTDGKTYHTQQITVPKTAVTYALLADPITYPNGTTISAKNISVTLTPRPQFCEYQLIARPEPTILNINLNLWKYYDIQSGKLVAKVDITSTESEGNKSFDSSLNSAASERTVILNEKDGNGILTATSPGLFSTGKNCPSVSGLIALDNNGKPKVVRKADYDSYKITRNLDTAVAALSICAPYFSTGGFSDPLNCEPYITSTYSDIITGSGINRASSFYTDLLFGSSESVIFYNEKTRLVGVASQGTFGNPLVLITADADYVDQLVAQKPVVVQPTVVSFTCGDVSEASTKTIRAIIQNDGDADDVFTYELTASRGTITPDDGTISIKAGDQGIRSFSYSIPSVSSQTTSTLSIEVCSTNQYGDKKCDAETASCTIKNDEGVIPQPPEPEPEPAPTPEACGLIANSHYENGACPCDDGFDTRYDQQTGQQSCLKPTDWYIYLPYVVLGVAVLGVGAAFMMRGKKGRRK